MDATVIVAPPPKIWLSSESRYTLPDVANNNNVYLSQIRFQIGNKKDCLNELKEKTYGLRATPDRVVVLSA